MSLSVISTEHAKYFFLFSFDHIPKLPSPSKTPDKKINFSFSDRLSQTDEFLTGKLNVFNPFDVRFSSSLSVWTSSSLQTLWFWSSFRRWPRFYTTTQSFFIISFQVFASLFLIFHQIVYLAYSICHNQIVVQLTLFDFLDLA